MLPIFLKRERRSAIINLASVAGEYPIPFIATYCATKAYNDFFTQAIQMEYSHKIDILSVRPMYVATGLSKMEKSCTVASSKECVQATLKYLGIDYETNGFYMHRLMSYLTSFLPSAILRCVAESESRKIMEAEKNATV
jgi:short-subunit dehydrogenase